MKLRRRVALAVVCAALTGGSLGAAVGAWIGWRSAGSLPSSAEAHMLAKEIVGVSPAKEERVGAVFAYDYGPDNLSPWVWMVGSDDYNGGYVELTFPATPTVELASVASRLSAAGWRTNLDRGELTGIRRPYTIIVTEEDGAIVLEFDRAEPRVVWPFSLAGWMVGAGASILLVLVMRRRAGQGQTWSRGLGTGGIVALAPATIMTSGQLIYSGVALPSTITPPALWGGYLFWGVRLCTNVGLLLLVFAAITTVMQIGAVRKSALAHFRW